MWMSHKPWVGLQLADVCKYMRWRGPQLRDTDLMQHTVSIFTLARAVLLGAL